jgi:predicted nucleic acid-binding protein
LIVVDASAAVEILLQLEQAEPISERLFADEEPLAAPELLDVEVAQVVRRYWLAGDISVARGAQAIADLADLPITRYPHQPLIERIWQLRNNATAYDASYFALAEALDATLVTRDTALQKIPGVRAKVEVY